MVRVTFGIGAVVACAAVVLTSKSSSNKSSLLPGLVSAEAFATTLHHKQGFASLLSLDHESSSSSTSPRTLLSLLPFRGSRLRRKKENRSMAEGGNSDQYAREPLASASAVEMRRGGGGGGGNGGSGSVDAAASAVPKKRGRRLLTRRLGREMVAEAIGTFMIVQFGCATVCAEVFKGAQKGIWQVAAVWTIGVTLAIATTAGVSGAHLNPAVTLAFAIVRDFDWKKVAFYILAQFVGGVLGGLVNYSLYYSAIMEWEAKQTWSRGDPESWQSAKAWGEYWDVPTAGAAFWGEALGTAVLGFVIFALTNPRNEAMTSSGAFIPPLIGMTVGALLSTIAPLTQAGFNPARDFAPRIVTWLAGWGHKVAFRGWWVYVLAPIAGALVGAALADKVLYNDAGEEEEDDDDDEQEEQHNDAADGRAH